MIKIAYVIDGIISPTAGTEKQLLLLLKHLDRTRFKPYLCILRTSPWIRDEFDLCELIEVNITSFRRLSNWWSLLKFAHFLRRERIDIVQVHFRDAGFAGILAARLAGVRSIISTRRSQMLWMDKRDVRIQKYLNRWVSIFIANSQDTKLLAIRNEVIPAGRIHVVYNAIDLEPYHKIDNSDRLMYRRQMGIPLDARIIGVVSNLRSVKGIETFLRAAAIVKAKVPNTKYLIIGDGQKRKEYEALSKDFGLQDAVLFLGSRSDIVELLSIIDVGVLSSNSESFSNAVVEYLAGGLPVVCTDVGGCREAIKDGKDGIIVPVGDYNTMAKAIIELLTRSNRTLERKPAEWVRKNCGLQNIVMQNEALYLQLYARR